MNNMEVDIISIDKKIRDVWKRAQDNIMCLDREISSLNNIVDDMKKKNNFLSVHIENDLCVKIKDLCLKKDKLNEMLENQHFYTMDFSELMEKYKKPENSLKKIVFMSTSKSKSALSQNDELCDISFEYFQILKKYNIESDDLEALILSKTQKSACQNVRQRCENFECDSKDFFINLEQNIEICKKCGTQKENVKKMVNYKDMSRVNISNKYNYERRIHFKDNINQYQGKQNATIDPQVYKDLEEQLELHGLLNSSSNKKEKFERVTKNHILLFLKETNHSKHYEDVVLIYHKLTGKKVPDISHLEVQLMEDFDLVSAAYDKLFKFTGKIERKSFINTQYVFFQLLKRHKYPCSKYDFNMLKTLDRKSFHDGIVRQIFEFLGFNFQPIF